MSIRQDEGLYTKGLLRYQQSGPRLGIGSREFRLPASQRWAETYYMTG